MNIEVIKGEVKALPAEERRKLIAFMVMLDQERPDYAATLARRIDDQSPERWLTPEQCEAKLVLSDSSK